MQLVVVNDTPASAIPDRTEIRKALARGVDLTTVRDNLRHASISTTSVYLHSDEVKRAKQLREAFTARRTPLKKIERILCSVARVP